MNDKPIEVLFYPATGDKTPVRKTLAPVPILGMLGAMQKLVDGFIEVIPHPGNKDLLIVCDEEGKMKDKVYNRPVLVDGHVTSFIFGDFFVCRNAGEEMVSLTEEDIEFLMADRFLSGGMV